MVLSRDNGSTGTALWVVPVSNLAGVARHVLDVARVGIPGWRLVVLCPEGPLADELAAAGTAVVTGEFGPDAGFRASCRTLRRTVRSLRPHVVHSHLSYADVVAAAVLAGDRRTRLVTTEHGIAADDLVYHGTQLKARLKAALHTARLRRADAVIAVSEATRTVMLSKWHPRQPVMVIPNGVDRLEPLDAPKAGEELSGTGIRVLSLSRLSAEKRIPELMRAFTRLRATEPQATLTIAGEGPLKEELQALARQLGVEDAVTFPGFVDPVPAMASADVLVQLSVWENCSYTLLDAVNAGLGLVATPVGGNPEILPERCLVEAEDEAKVAVAIHEQASRENRPVLPSNWPDTAAMTARIRNSYQQLVPEW